MIDIIILYLLAYMSVLLHEVMHIFFAKMFDIEILSIKIGAEWPLIKIGKLSISPLIGSSFVEAVYEDLEKANTVKKVVYFTSGIIANIFLSVFFCFVYKQMGGFIFRFISLMNVGFAFVNSVPLFKTDMANLISFLSKKEK